MNRGKITDIAQRHLAVIFGDHKGEKWEPINQDAQVLLVKGGPKDGVQVTGRKPFLTKLAETFKGIFGPITVEVDDDIDNDGDGADDYNMICGLISNLYYDIQSAWGIQDQEARGAAVKIAIDNFVDTFDECRGMIKAGKRHSAADQSHLDAIAAATPVIVKALGQAADTAQEMQDHIDALTGSQGGASDDDDDEKATVTIDAEQESAVVTLAAPGEDGRATWSVKAATQADADAALVAAREKADKSKEGDYGSDDEAGYADTKNKKYPLKKDGKLNKKRIRAAWSYINMPKNQKGYDSDELAAIKKNIKAAAKEVGIEISDDSGKGAPHITVNVAGDGNPSSENIAKAIQSALTGLSGEFSSQIGSLRDTIAADVKKAIDEVEAAGKAERQELATSVGAMQAQLGGMVAKAREPQAPGAVPTVSTDGSKKDPADPNGSTQRDAAKAKLKSGEVTSIAETIALTRMANS